MRYFILICVIVLISSAGYAADDPYSRNVELHYRKVVETLKEHNITGPFGEEVAKYALMRQILEDGTNRPHHTSIVGMYPGGLNERVMKNRLGLSKDHPVYKLYTVPTPEGTSSYAVAGPYANVLSAAAIALVWDEYINGGVFSVKRAYIDCWNLCCVLSAEIANKTCSEEQLTKYKEMSQLREEAIHRVNSMYGPNAVSVKQQVKRLEKEFRKFQQYE
jgi:hypothetical protein